MRLNATTHPRWPRAVLLLAATAAALLWLLPLFTPHSVLFPPGPNYADITVYHGRFTLYHTHKFFTSRAFSGFAYPPGAAPIYEFFYNTSSALNTYLTLAALTTVLALLAAWLYLRPSGLTRYLLLLPLFSFPLIILIQRANIELILWLLIALGLILYRRNLAIPAAILFGLAAAIKLYPILLLGLFLTHRQHRRAFFIGLATAAVALIAATTYTGPTFLIAAHGFTTGLGNFQNHYIDKAGSVEVAFDHSLFSPFKYIAFSNHTSPAPWRPLYYLLAGAFALLLFLRVRTLPSLNRIVFLIAAMVCLPPVSFTYTLVHLYVPVLLLLTAIAASRTMPFSATATLALLLFLTLPLVSLNVLQPTPTGPIQSCVLFAILILCSLTPWPDKKRSNQFIPETRSS
ncbi:DUF2029 domain-containing protein [Granulicella sp. 5B5]|uniref:glycosyltransferase family 87 protein n=1 Tax=Granulicella sp. 5B5 TaxID=1617967 RepID=UPI0015F75FA4|nr:glycosyltransferase family 87 protein [Granulicella sp. 5B5]QMV17654.1 DUF2029 domain-containing protein [Granulicella sp. 5B5]